MSSRQVRRAQLKAQYRRFSDAWRRERAYQLAQANRPDNEPTGPVLGRRPTFVQWQELVRSAEARRSATPQEVQAHADDIPELDWEEG